MKCYLKWEWQVGTRLQWSSHAASELDFGTAAITGEQRVHHKDKEAERGFPGEKKGEVVPDPFRVVAAIQKRYHGASSPATTPSSCTSIRADEPLNQLKWFL